MKKFLYSVAEDLWQRYGEQVSSLTIVLPNNRTRIFLIDALSAIADRPIWGPSYISIDSLMTDASGLGRIERIVALTELYKIYCRHGHANESFDNFYHWGEVLLNDFDAVDKYMVDARMLFANVADLKALSRDNSYLTDEQVEAIQRFCNTFAADKTPSEHQQRFLSVWDTLWPIYSEFTTLLESRGVGYSGLIYRRAAERIRKGEDVISDGRYVVVGFNALSTSEKVLFDALQTRFDADFYWDYDDYYVNNEGQEAGLFVRENLRRYAPPASFRPESSAFALPKRVNVVSTASDSLQCKYAAEFVEDVARTTGQKPDKRTAIVLTDEGLLSPLLYSLPSEVEGHGGVEYNVTMGYPLKATLAYSFVERLLQLQHRVRLQKNGRVLFYHSDVEGLLVHPYLVAIDRKGCSEVRHKVIKQGRIYIDTEIFAELHSIIKAVFTIHADMGQVGNYVNEILSLVMRVDLENESKESRALRRECFGLIMEGVEKCTRSLVECEVEMKFSTYISLLRRVLQTIRIPYKGEPLSGVQVMGILETRNLDFDNVLLLSMNDDNFPSGRINEISFIPYNLRFGYGLPTIKETEGVYAYYFYRLIQRAERVDMAYCSVATERSSGEQSRYIYQLDFESGHGLVRIDKGLSVNLSNTEPKCVEKDAEVMRRLERFLTGGDKRLSPSAYNNYLDCPLKFYFRSVAEIKPEDEIDEEVSESLFGTIFHRTMEILYTPLIGKENPQALIAELINSEKVHQAIVEAITIDYFAGEKVPEEEYGGSLMVVRDAIERYVNNSVLAYDSTRQEQFKILALEYSMETDFEFAEGKAIRFFGNSDRLDLVDGRVKVIDYKTGKVHLDFSGIDALFSRTPQESVGAVTQTFVYSMMAARLQRQGVLKEGHGVFPALYYVRHMNNPQYMALLNDGSAKRHVESYEDYADSFESALAQSLSTLFDSSVPFVATDDLNKCKYCDFVRLCNRCSNDD